MLQSILAFVKYTQNSPLHEAHANVLRAPVERWCGASDPMTVVCSYAILLYWPKPPSDAATQLLHLIHDTPSNKDSRDADVELVSNAWHVATAYVDQHVCAPDGLVLDALRRDLALNQRCVSAAEMLQVLLRLAARDSRFRELHGKTCEYFVSQLRREAAIKAREAFCQLWPDYAHICMISTGKCPKALKTCIRMLEPLLQDSVPTIRAASVRALGVLWANEPNSVTMLRYDECLTWFWETAGLLDDADLLVRNRAAWTWANGCAGIQAFEESVFKALYDALGHDDDRVAVHAVRGLGSMLPLAPDTAYECAAHRACGVLTRSRTPKLRWNAATCVSRAMERRKYCPKQDKAMSNSEDIVRKVLDVCVEHLALALRHDSTFKVRRLAAQALDSLDNNDVANLGPTARAALVDAVTEADAHLETHVREASSFTEAQRHGYACISLVQALHKRLARS